MFRNAYDDFTFSSEEEYVQDEVCQQEELQHEQHQDEYIFEEDIPMADIDDDFNKGEVSDHSTDTDEYANCFTDHEKYVCDRLRWEGIPNTRKYTIAKRQRKSKGEEKGRDKIANEDQPTKQDKPKESVKPRGRGEKQSDEEVDALRQPEIHFDARGDLWYSHKSEDVLISERATFHHWIRPGLIQVENAKGTYDFPRMRGPGNYDVTCFNEVQKHWGLERTHYAPVMFVWERMGRADPVYQLSNLYYQNLLVIDYWLKPVLNFRELPLVISSVFEGGFMEPATRLHSRMTYEDIRARMPPFVKIEKGGQTSFKALSKASALSGRSRHFRESAGAISWDRREGSDKIKSFIENIVKPTNNSTGGSRDLTKEEIHRLRLMNHGSKPARAKSGTTQKSKDKYIADTYKAAGVTLATETTQNAGDKIDDFQGLEADDGGVTLAGAETHQEMPDWVWQLDPSLDYGSLYYDQEDPFVENPLAFTEDITYQGDESLDMEARDTAPPRFIFSCIEAPFLRTMTEEQAATNFFVNMSDPRNHIPKSLTDVLAIRDALKVTIDHFKEIFGTEPRLFEGSNYISEYCNIQDQMDDHFPDDATALRRLGRWEGTILDWERADVHDDPCFGRRQPFGPVSLPVASTDFLG